MFFSDVTFLKFLRCVHLKLPNQKEVAQMLQLKLKKETHTILKCEFNHLSKFLIGFSPHDIDRIVHKATIKRNYRLIKEAKAFKKVSFQEGSVQYSICSADDPEKINVSFDDVMEAGFAAPKLSAKDLLEIIKRSKPFVSPIERERHEKFEERMRFQ